MVYEYAEWKPQIFTDNGVRQLFKVVEEVNRLLNYSGSFRYESLCLSGDSWLHIAYIDYLTEIGYLHEIPTKGPTQHRIFVRGEF